MTLSDKAWFRDDLAQSCAHSSTVRPACRRMDRRVPTETSRCFGTIAVLSPPSTALANLTWLPSCATTSKPAERSLCLTRRYGSGSSGMQLNVYRAKFRHNRCARWAQMQTQCLAEVRKRFIFRLTLACHIQIQALSDVQLAFLPYASPEALLHTASRVSSQVPRKAPALTVKCLCYADGHLSIILSGPLVRNHGSTRLLGDRHRETLLHEVLAQDLRRVSPVQVLNLVFRVSI